MFRTLRPQCLSCEGLDTTSSTQAHEGRGFRERIRGLRVCSAQLNNRTDNREKEKYVYRHCSALQWDTARPARSTWDRGERAARRGSADWSGPSVPVER